MAAGVSLQDQLTRFADLSKGGGWRFSLNFVHDQLGETCYVQNIAKVMTAISFALGSCAIYYTRKSKPLCALVSFLLLPTAASCAYKAIQSRRQINATLKCCDDTLEVLSPLVDRVQEALLKLVNARLAKKQITAGGNATTIIETKAKEFFELMTRSVTGLSSDDEEVRRALRNFFQSKYASECMEIPLKKLQASYPAQQRLLDTCKNIYNALYRIQYGYESQNPQIRYFDCALKDGIYQATRWPIALPKEKIKA